MEINIPEPAKRKANIYGQAVELSDPTVDQIIELTEKTEGLAPSKQLPAMKAFAVGLGLPQAIAGKLRFSDFTSLIGELTGAKKK